jgi:hypothetical protein
VVPTGFKVVVVVVVVEELVGEAVDVVDVVEGAVEWRLKVTMTTNAAKIASALSVRLTD